MKTKQKGATLVIVMIFLIVLTVLGVASMSDSIIQQKSSTNVYLETEAFHVAESAISALLNADKLKERLLFGSTFDDDIASYDPDTKEVNPVIPYFCVSDKGAVKQAETKAECSADFEGNSGLNAVAQIEYLGCKTCPGNEFGGLINCNAWKITGISKVAETTTSEVDNWVIKTAGCDSSGSIDAQPIL